MNNDKRIIHLNFEREHFEEIYDLRKYGSIFQNPHLKKYLSAVFILTVIVTISLFFSIFQNKSIFLSLVLSFGLFVAIITLYTVAKPYLKWKKNVLEYLKHNRIL